MCFSKTGINKIGLYFSVTIEDIEEEMFIDPVFEAEKVLLEELLEKIFGTLTEREQKIPRRRFGFESGRV